MTDSFLLLPSLRQFEPNDINECTQRFHAALLSSVLNETDCCRGDAVIVSSISHSVICVSLSGFVPTDPCSEKRHALLSRHCMLFICLECLDVLFVSLNSCATECLLLCMSSSTHRKAVVFVLVCFGMRGWPILGARLRFVNARFVTTEQPEFVDDCHPFHTPDCSVTTNCKVFFLFFSFFCKIFVSVS